MEVRWTILWIIIAGGFLTFIPRIVPLVFLSRVQLPPGVEQWLSYVPIAIMAALVGQELLLSDEQFTPITNNPALWTAIPAFLFAYWTRSLLGTVIIGIIIMAALRLFM